MKYFLIALMMLSANLKAVTFSDEQIANLTYAFKFGEQFNTNGTPKQPNEAHKPGLGYVFAAIAWQESSAYEDPRKLSHSKGHQAYGMFQNYLPTVKSRFKQMGIDMPKEEIIRLLISRENSAEWSYIELKTWLKYHKGHLRNALASYNGGYNWKSKQTQGYAKSVLNKATYLKNNKIVVNPKDC